MSLGLNELIQFLERKSILIHKAVPNYPVEDKSAFVEVVA